MGNHVFAKGHLNICIIHGPHNTGRPATEKPKHLSHHVPGLYHMIFQALNMVTGPEIIHHGKGRVPWSVSDTGIMVVGLGW